MSHKKTKQDFQAASRDSLAAEMAEPRKSRSARIEEIKLDKARFAEPASTTVPGTVEKIIPPQPPANSGTAQIALDGSARNYRKLRIENTLIDEHGDDVSLKKGAHVQVTVAERAASKKPGKT